MTKAVFLFFAGILLFSPAFSQAEDDPSDSILVIREGKQLKNTVVTVEVYLLDDVLEITVSARMRKQRPRINYVYLKGPNIGKIHYKSRKPVPPSVEDEGDEKFAITKVDGLIMFGNRTKEKVPKGRLAKDLFKLKVPRDKIKSNKRYQLIVEVGGQDASQRIPKFKFDLKNLAQLISW